MDLIKIGKYIASKRKSLGMTQKQLAEKLGMSDKSVSKWERGVCLPDVSVYKELCFVYDNDEMSVLTLDDFINSKTDFLSKNDYVYYVAFEFCK